MASRMERYYNGEERSKKNKNLYDRISTNGNYTNIESVVDISNNNEINIENIKELIEGSQSTKHSKPVERIEKPKPKIKTKEDEKNYDIMDVLSKAKTGYSEKDLRYRNIKRKQIQILKELKNDHPEDEKIDELMNTLALDGSFSDDLGMFDELKSNTMVGNEMSSIKSIIDEAKEFKNSEDLSEELLQEKDLDATRVDMKIEKNKIEDSGKIEEIKEKKDKEDEEIINELDNSFYTASFKDKAFVQPKSNKKQLKENSKALKVLAITFSTILAITLLVIIAILIF